MAKEQQATCKECHGKGRYIHEGDTLETRCEGCNGHGFLIADECPACHGRGHGPVRRKP